jgi:hypothetical protein
MASIVFKEGLDDGTGFRLTNYIIGGSCACCYSPSRFMYIAMIGWDKSVR